MVLKPTPGMMSPLTRQGMARAGKRRLLDRPSCCTGTVLPVIGSRFGTLSSAHGAGCVSPTPYFQHAAFGHGERTCSGALTFSKPGPSLSLPLVCGAEVKVNIPSSDTVAQQLSGGVDSSAKVRRWFRPSSPSKPLTCGWLICGARLQRLA
ncbi:hypothetical protein LY78DRAFT_102061 [Colletotrichum sublineola]|nr:hypothetical protein LY78DRAFT_102061 [Colletotrichum sublineola]